MAPKIPDDWKMCKTTHGTPIDGTFVAFKMPITGKNWDVPDVLKAFPDLKMVITLQYNTRDYYQEDLFKDQKVVYCPMNSKTIPKEEKVTEFFYEVDEILKTDPNALIGVHDVNGINRTGYMICRYLIEKRGWNPKEAIKAFEKARGEKMEKHGKYVKCIQDLRDRTLLSD